MMAGVVAAASCRPAAAPSRFWLRSSRNHGCHTIANSAMTSSRNNNAGVMVLHHRNLNGALPYSCMVGSRTTTSNNTILVAAAAARQERYYHPGRCCCFTTSRRMIGGFSRMLDLGGAPSSLHDNNSQMKRLNLNKNCHLQAVIFDFGVLTRSVERERKKDDDSSSQKVSKTAAAKKFSDSIVGSTSSSLTAPIQPDTGMVEQVAGLLNVDLSGEKDKPIADRTFEDDLSLLTGEAPPPRKNNKNKQEATIQRTKTANATTPSNTSSSSSDIRAKYAAKLRSAGLGGGLSAVDRAKHEVTDGAEQRGDAAGHLAARKIVASSSSSSSSRWMAATGTGKLLNYLHQRSMKLALVGTPVVVPEDGGAAAAESSSRWWQDEARQMNDFTKQMKDKVVFAATVPQDGTRTVDQLAQRAFQELLLWKAAATSDSDDGNSSGSAATTTTTTTIEPDRCLWVSDRDDCLRAAREAGLVTVRVRPRNARRGNVSAHYTVASVPETQEVINEINGVSFNAVLHQHGV